MKLKSLQTQANLNIVKFASIYSTLLSLIILLIAFFNYTLSRKETIESELKSLANSFSSYTLNQNYPSLVKQFQIKTSLQEIVITDLNCKQLASTTLIGNLNCRELSNRFKSLKLIVNSQKIVVYYDTNINVLEFLKTNIDDIILLNLILFFITTFILFSFFYLSVIKPLKEIKTITDENEIYLPKELRFLEDKLLEMKTKIKQTEGDRQSLQLAKKVIHDIRNPLTYLKTSTKLNKFNESIFLDRINEIDYHIQSLINSEVTTISEFNFAQKWHEISKEIKESFQILCSTNHNGYEDVKLYVHWFDLKNIILNLVRNSKEALATRIEINSSIEKSQLIISINDNGSGIPENIVGEIFTKQITSKKFGNGIGLYSINQFLTRKNSTIDINHNSIHGLGIRISIPVVTENFSSNLVLIDDDKFIHHAWRMQSEKLGIEVYSYFTIDDFIKNQHIHLKEIPVYIDSNLKSGKKGEIRAKEIYELGFHNIFLTTSFTDIEINKFPWISKIYSKTGPF